MRIPLVIGASSLFVVALSCGTGEEAGGPAGAGGKGDSSHLATFLNFEFDGAMVLEGSWGIERHIDEQLLYTIGILNGENSVGRLDNVELTDVEHEPVNPDDEEDRSIRVTYHAKMLVAWGKKNDVPETYELVLPLDASHSGLRAFTDKYKGSCVSWSAHDVDVNSMWYYFRPEAYNCALAAEDVVRAKAQVTQSPVETQGKYPEYHKIWEDQAFKVVGIFGKYEKTSTDNSDTGVRGFVRFIGRVESALEAAGGQVSTVPEELPEELGVETPDVTIKATLPDGRKVEVVSLLVSSIGSAGWDFYQRYEGLTPDADYIFYKGHSGLGANIRTLANRGKWVTGQYVIVMMNGCDTYAYVDASLAEAHTAVNPDDPQGTKYLDLVMNAMPSSSGENSAMMAFVNALMDRNAPKTYQEIFEEAPSGQVILVSGEQDNAFQP